jgi:hypothetical protein
MKTHVMNSQTHILLGAALLGGRIPKRAFAAALGGLVPDIPMFAIVGALKLFGLNDMLIFGVLYWQPWWQITNAISHSFLLWGGGVAAAILWRERKSLSAAAIDGWSLIVAFFASGILHVFIDFLCHREDAHMSFWPVSNWKFVSPVSYWDAQYYGTVFGIFETVIGIACAIVIFRQFSNRAVRIGLVALVALYVAMPFYWYISFG